MVDTVRETTGRRILVCDCNGPALESVRAITDLIGLAWETDASVVAVPLSRLPQTFLCLRTGVAGEIMQKFVSYGLTLAILGDVGAAAAKSDALRDFIYETNLGSAVWFVSDLQALAARLAVKRP